LIVSSERVREVAAEVLAFELAVGYVSREHLIELLGDALDDDEQEVTDSMVVELVDAALTERRREEQTWRGPTDHDRLVAALEDAKRWSGADVDGRRQSRALGVGSTRGAARRTCTPGHASRARFRAARPPSRARPTGVPRPQYSC